MEIIIGKTEQKAETNVVTRNKLKQNASKWNETPRLGTK